LQTGKGKKTRFSLCLTTILLELAGINQQVAVSDLPVNKSGWQYTAKRAKISDENGPCR